MYLLYSEMGIFQVGYRSLTSSGIRELKDSVGEVGRSKIIVVPLYIMISSLSFISRTQSNS